MRFQPRSADFQKEVGADVRAVLEAALERHSTLSEGDWISVPFAGRAFDLFVQKLRPGRAVSVIGARSVCRLLWQPMHSTWHLPHFSRGHGLL